MTVWTWLRWRQDAGGGEIDDMSVTITEAENKTLLGMKVRDMREREREREGFAVSPLTLGRVSIELLSDNSVNFRILRSAFDGASTHGTFAK